MVQCDVLRRFECGFALRLLTTRAVCFVSSQLFAVTALYSSLHEHSLESGHNPPLATYPLAPQWSSAVIMAASASAAAASAKPADMEDEGDWGDAGGEGDDAGDWGEADDAGDWGDAEAADAAMPATVSPIITRQSSYLVLDNDSLSEQQSALIRQTAEVLFVTPSEAGCLLRHYGWKARKLQQEWFEAQKKVRETVGLTAEEDAKQPPRTAEGLVQCCSAYCDEVPPEQAHALNCGHVFCSDCWSNYLTSQISHGAASVFASCMGMRCTLNHVHKLGCQCKEMVPEALFTKYVTDPSLLSKYRRWLLDSFVEGQRQIKWCPKPGCIFAVTYQAGGTKSIQCKCGHFCM